MNRSRLLSSLAASALGIALLGACSAESLTERAVGFGLEQAIEAETGEDVDFDFGDGGFNITTEEGELSFDLDGDNGTILFDSADGSGAITFDDEGNIVFDTDEGSGTVNIDEDGSIVYDTDQGSGTVQIDENGLVVDTEDGNGSFSLNGGSGAVPDNWSPILAVPQSYDAEASSFAVFEEATSAIYTADVRNAPDGYADQVGAQLQAAGFEKQEAEFAGLTSYRMSGSFVEVLQGEDSQDVYVRAVFKG